MRADKMRRKTMHPQDQRLLNKRITTHNVCKVCFGGLVERRIDGEDVVVCAEDPTHEGTIGKSQALAIEREQRLQAVEVLQNYPQLRQLPITETAQESIDLLWG